ncbi:hypothetical protein PanWU01x14_252390 [Parasponia andersonii]|uniref:Uncharacterized protein n=1 Tax=Parasponia andersonii TaxID=3476 RepID=A0A2P5BC48_PARAD|nr:hypothetical protein PanWU01x14_252390 [Parasponia andersonii]
MTSRLEFSLRTTFSIQLNDNAIDVVLSTTFTKDFVIGAEEPETSLLWKEKSTSVERKKFILAINVHGAVRDPADQPRNTAPKRRKSSTAVTGTGLNSKAGESFPGGHNSGRPKESKESTRRSTTLIVSGWAPERSLADDLSAELCSNRLENAETPQGSISVQINIILLTLELEFKSD